MSFQIVANKSDVHIHKHTPTAPINVYETIKNNLYHKVIATCTTKITEVNHLKDINQTLV